MLPTQVLQASRLEAELEAINLWDRLLAESLDPNQIEKDAGNARFFRRTQVTMQLLEILKSPTDSLN